MGCLQNDMLYVLYSWPTVIISRRTDQYEKAYESLRGHAPNMQKKARLKGAADLGLDKPAEEAGRPFCCVSFPKVPITCASPLT